MFFLLGKRIRFIFEYKPWFIFPCISILLLLTRTMNKPHVQTVVHLINKIKDLHKITTDRGQDSGMKSSVVDLVLAVQPHSLTYRMNKAHQSLASTYMFSTVRDRTHGLQCAAFSYNQLCNRLRKAVKYSTVGG